MSGNERKLPQLLFDHIQKTAGTTIYKALAGIYGSDNCSPHVSELSLGRTLKKYESKCFIHGHFWLVPGQSLPSNRYIFTCIRSPIDRVISLYFYWRNAAALTPENRNKCIDAAESLTLEEFVYSDDPEILAHTSNHQVKHFAGVAGQPGTELYQKAEEMLRDYDAVGVLDDVSGLLDLVCFDNGIPEIEAGRPENVNRDRPKLSELSVKVRARLEALNELDLKLFEYAKERFECDRLRTESAFNYGQRRKDMSASSDKGGATCAVDPRYGREHPYLDYGTKEVELKDVEIFFDTSSHRDIDDMNRMIVRVTFIAHAVVNDLTVGIRISDSSSNIVIGSNTKLLGITSVRHVIGINIIEFVCEYNFLKSGEYEVTAALHTSENHETCCYHWKEGIAHFIIGQQEADCESPFTSTWKCLVSN